MTLHIDRRSLLATLTGLGISSVTMARAIAIEVEAGAFTADSIANAEWISGVELSAQQREDLLRSINQMLDNLRRLREVSLDADIPPALQFAPSNREVGTGVDRRSRKPSVKITLRRAERPPLPDSEVAIAFASIAQLGRWLRRREISSVELTKLFLGRLERFGPQLNCVVTLTEELAMRQARQADREISSGRLRGPLHGIPWGAKDLIAVSGYPTTWGAEIYKNQVRMQTATVATRLADAGCVLVAKLTLGAFAMGDLWFGGKTLNPWDLSEGASGSSAGSAAATSAGLVPFAIGSETLGSIVSPSRRCGTTGFRPTFGRVSRAGCMPLAWSFDKIGPIARSVEDCAIVFAAIQGSDGIDPTVEEHPFHWPDRSPLSHYRIGYTGERSDRPELDLLEDFGAEVISVKLPEAFPLGALTTMIDVESASMFYEVWKDGTEDGLFRWAKIWQTAAFIPAIDYVRAARVRTLLMRATEECFAKFDLLVGADDLLLTNLTGHPSVVIPWRPSRSRQVTNQVKNQAPERSSKHDEESQDRNVQSPTDRAPGSLVFTGHLFRDDRLLSVADVFQRAAGDNTIHPPLFYRDAPQNP